MIRVSFEVPFDMMDMAEDFLWVHEALSVETTPPHAERHVLKALFSEFDAAEFSPALADFAEQWGLATPSIHVETVDEEDWQVSWRASFKPLQVGGFRLLGEWEADQRTLTDRDVLIYPGQAFGTGQHATTRLAVCAMERLTFEGKSVLDIGCGTGLLAIVAERLGAERIEGFDVDPDAEENMQRHLRINGCRRTELKIGTVETLPLSRYDFVLANITLNVLSEVWPRVPELLNPEGVMVTTGLLVEQEEEARTRLETLGFRITERTESDGWICLVAKRS